MKHLCRVKSHRKTKDVDRFTFLQVTDKFCLSEALCTMLFYFLIFFFLWRKIDLQCCTSFCYTVYSRTVQLQLYIPSLPFEPPSPSHPAPLGHHRAPDSLVSICPFSTSPLLLCNQLHQYHFSRLHIFDICFSIFDLLRSLLQALGSSTSLPLTQSCLLLWELEFKRRKPRDTQSNRQVWHLSTNEAGQRLTEFCQENTQVIANTLFQQHEM